MTLFHVPYCDQNLLLSPSGSTHLFYLRHSVSGILLWQPQQTFMMTGFSEEDFQTLKVLHVFL